MSRGNARQDIFLDAADHLYFLHRLSVTTKRFRVRCHAYCLMINHFHLLLEPTLLPIADMMQQLNSSVSQRFNHRHGRVGHVLSGRYKAFHIARGDYYRRVLRYIARNPVRSGLVRNAVDWHWSSYRATAGLEAPRSFLTVIDAWRAFNPDNRRHAQRLYRAFVDGPVIREDDDAAAARTSFVSRDEALAAIAGDQLALHCDNAELVYAERFAVRPPLGRIFTCERDAHARDRFMLEAFDTHGYSLREIGEFIGKRPKTVWKRIQHARLTSREDEMEEKIEI